jgi:hypothetical protein
MKSVRRWPRQYKPRLAGNTTGFAAPHVWQWAASLSTHEGHVDANVSSLTAEQLRDGPGAPRKLGAPQPKGDQMPTELNTMWSGERALRGDAWVPLLMAVVHKQGAPSIATGPMSLTGEVGVYLDGAPAGTQIQLRPYLVEHVGGAWVQSRSLGTVEVVATPGTTFCRIPVTCAIPAGQRLRMKVKATGSVVQTFANLLTWKG